MMILTMIIAPYPHVNHAQGAVMSKRQRKQKKRLMDYYFLNGGGGRVSPTKHSDLTPRRGEEDETKNTHSKSVPKKIKK